MIIALSGKAGVGKDTAADMLQYLLSTPSFLHNYSLYKNTPKWLLPSKYAKSSYALGIKKILGIMLDIDYSLFEDRKFKKHAYIQISSLKIIHKKSLPDNCEIVTGDELKSKNISAEFLEDKYVNMRTLLQLIGTNVFRTTFNSNVWANMAFRRPCENLIITDQRFENEYRVAKDNGAVCIHIHGKIGEDLKHESELSAQRLYDNNLYDYAILNNGTLEDLFYACKRTLNNFKK